eukprot:12383435-Karenia_brevis.AAC.1
MCDDSQFSALPTDSVGPALVPLLTDVVAEATGLGEVRAGASTQHAAAHTAPPHSGLGSTPQPVLLASDFTTRLRQLQPNTVPHIPVSL